MQLNILLRVNRTKKYIGLATFVFAIIFTAMLPLQVYAQDATYSCGAYGAGDYSTSPCTKDSSTGGETSSGQPGSSSEPTSDGSAQPSTAPSDEMNEGDEKQIDANQESDSGMFTIIFAKLATSWGWVVIFGILLIIGVVLIGWTWRQRRVN